MFRVLLSAALVFLFSGRSFCLNVKGNVNSTDGWSGFLFEKVIHNGGFEINKLSVTLRHEEECNLGTLHIRLFFSDVGRELYNISCQELNTSSPLKNEVARTSFPMHCGNKYNSSCSCEKMIIMPKFTRNATMYLGFDGCFLRRPLSMEYSFSFSLMGFTCKTSRKNFPCTKAGVFRKYQMDNETNGNAIHFLTRHVVDVLVTQSKYTPSLLCYQHAVQAMCRVKFPKCPNDSAGHSTICRETCEEFCEGCSRYLKTLALLPNLEGMCPLFLSRQENPSCWYKPVDCGPPPPVENATVKISRKGRKKFYYATYKCSSEFMLKGKARITCYLSGQWSSKLPICVENKKLPLVTIVLSCMAAVLVNVIILSTCYFRKEVQAVLYVRIGCTIGRRFEIPRKYSAYIVSTGDDADRFVDKYLLPHLEERHGLRVLASVRDGRLGATLQEDCYNAMKECSRAVFVVDEEFLDSPSLCHLFQQSEDYEKTRKYFRVIVLLDMNCRKQEICNTSLGAFIKAGCFLSPHHHFFIDRLLYSLPSPTRSGSPQDCDVESRPPRLTTVTETSHLLAHT